MDAKIPFRGAYNDTQMHFICFAVEYFSIVGVCAVLSTAIVHSNLDKFVKYLLLEVLAAFQVIVGASEGGCIMAHYGVTAWCVYTILRIMLQDQLFHGATSDPVMTLLDQGISLWKKPVIATAQVVSGFLALALMPYLWKLSFSILHAHKVHEIDEGVLCVFDLKIPVYQAFMLQFLYILSIYYVDHRLPASSRKWVVPVYLIVVAAPGLAYTGMHISILPVIVFNWRCQNTSLVSIALVYLLPPMLAHICASTLRFTELRNSEKTTQKQTRKSNSEDTRTTTDDKLKTN